MNPEEGELRPQLLDRFGLTVEVAAPREPALRAEVVRRRMAYDADPAGFRRQLRRRRGRAAVADRGRPQAGRRGRLSDAALLRIAEVCAAFEVDGLRADIVMARTASAHAAWCGRDAVVLEDIGVAARLALPHRRRRNPFDAPGSTRTCSTRCSATTSWTPEPDPDPTTRTPEPDRAPTGLRRPRRRTTGRQTTRTAPGREPHDVTEREARRRRMRGPDDDAAPRRRTAPGCSRCAAPAPVRRAGAAGRSPRPAAGSAPSAPTGDRRGAAPGRDDPGRGAAPVRPRADRRPAGAAHGRPAGRRPGGAGVQPGALLRRRVRLDGGAQADGAGQDRRAQPAARRLPAAGQGRAGDVPRRPAPTWRCRRPTRSTRPPPGSRTCRPAAGRRSPRACSRRPRCSRSSGSATPGAGRCSSS